MFCVVIGLIQRNNFLLSKESIAQQYSYLGGDCEMVCCSYSESAHFLTVPVEHILVFYDTVD